MYIEEDFTQNFVWVYGYVYKSRLESMLLTNESNVRQPFFAILNEQNWGNKYKLFFNYQKIAPSTLRAGGVIKYNENFGKPMYLNTFNK